MLTLSPLTLFSARLPGERVRKSAHVTVAPACLDALDYWRGMAQLWAEPRTFVNVEHDMEFSDALVDELAACPHPLCTHAYAVHFPTTHQHEPHFAHSVSLVGERPPLANVAQYTARGVRWIEDGEEWADFSGLGFCKVTPSARIGPLPEATWNWLEMSVAATVSERWHVHWPAVEHYHQ